MRKAVVSSNVHSAAGRLRATVLARPDGAFLGSEDVLEQDTIPAGYEFYVRRYFQLIRPRQAE